MRRLWILALLVILLLGWIVLSAQQPAPPNPQPASVQTPANPLEPDLSPTPSRAAPASEAPEQTRRVFVGCEDAIEISTEPPPPPPVKNEEGKSASLGKTATSESPVISRRNIIKVILGLAALLTMAYVAGHPRFQSLEYRFRVAHLATAGFPFVLLGWIAGHPAVDIISQPVLRDLRPLVTFGLGWVGFAVGFRFDVRRLTGLQATITSVVAVTTLVPAALIVAVSLPLLAEASGDSATWTAVRDAFILATAGAMTAGSAPMLLRYRGASERSIERLAALVHLEQLAAVIGLMLLVAFFRPEGLQVAWQLPGVAWIFIILGLGTMMGAVIYVLITMADTGPHFALALLGSVAFAGGMASYLRLSPVVVCFIAGAIAVNFPGEWRARASEALTRLERPIYFVFLVIAGALWRGAGWYGWVMMLLFVAARFAGKWLATTSVRSQAREAGFGAAESRAITLAPIGALSIAVIVSAQDLYLSPNLPLLVTAVIGGAVVTEIVTQFAYWGRTVAADDDLNPDAADPA